MRKGIVTTLVVLLAFCVGFVVYGGGTQEAKVQEVTIQMWAGPESRAMSAVVDKWNQDYADMTGIKVSLVTIGRVGYNEKVTSQLVGGVDKPDLIQIFNWQVGLLNPYIVALDSYFKSKLFSSPEGKAYDVKGMIDTAFDTGKMEGKTFLLPTDISWNVTIYRKDLLEKAGVKPPDTWEEVVPVAKKFTRSYNPSSPTEYGTSAFGKLIFPTWLSFIQVIWSYGGGYFKPGTFEPDLNSEAGYQAGRYFWNLGKSKTIPPDSAESYEFPETVAAFQNEIIAFAPFWNAAFPMVTSKEQSPKVYDKMALADLPGVRQTDGTIKRASYIHCISLGINKASKMKDAAFKFLAYATFGEGAVLYAENGGAPPLWEVFTGPNAVEPYKSGANIIADYGRTNPPCADMPALFEIGKVYVQKLLLNEGSSPEQIMDDLNKEMYEFLKERDYF
jgi:multiple sugar transport system substrate-binding protein